MTELFLPNLHVHVFNANVRKLSIFTLVSFRTFMLTTIQKGERIGIWAPNRAEWTIAQFATSKLGLILVNINPAYLYWLLSISVPE